MLLPAVAAAVAAAAAAAAAASAAAAAAAATTAFRVPSGHTSGLPRVKVYSTLL